MIISYGMVTNAFYPFVLIKRFKLVVNLWHGFPLKRVGDQARQSFERQRRFERQRYSKLVASSKVEQLAFACSFSMNIDDIWITGAPRNDILCRPGSNQPGVEGIPAEARVILYAPTWRDGEQSAQVFPFADVDLDRLDRLLDRIDAYLIVRFHYIERAQATAVERRRILLDPGNRFGEVQRLLSRSDVLVTDYSSIMFDFLLLNCPLIFIPYDVESYARTRGFMFDYDDVTPGPKVRTWEEFLGALAQSVERAPEEEAKRLRLRALTHQHADGAASRRIVEKVSQATCDLLGAETRPS